MLRTFSCGPVMCEAMDDDDHHGIDESGYEEDDEGGAHIKKNRKSSRNSVKAMSKSSSRIKRPGLLRDSFVLKEHRWRINDPFVVDPTESFNLDALDVTKTALKAVECNMIEGAFLCPRNTTYFVCVIVMKLLASWEKERWLQKGARAAFRILATLLCSLVSLSSCPPFPPHCPLLCLRQNETFVLIYDVIIANSPIEDKFVVHIDENLAFFGVFDGHGGVEVADFCRALPLLLSSPFLHSSYP